MQLTNTQIQHAIGKLPENIKQAVLTFNWAQEILDIAHEHHMQIDDADEFRQQTLLVILGETRAEDYEQKLIHTLGIPKEKALLLVQEANARIFLELQKRAFGNTESPDEDVEDIVVSDDPYQEPIEHHELQQVLRSEGIELVDEHAPTVIHHDLHTEVSEILSENTHTKKPIEPTEINPGDKINSTDAPVTENLYQESIETHDLRGIKGHRINTDILSTQHHTTPENILDDKPDRPQGRDLGQGTYTMGSLDKHMLENPFLAKTDTVTVSPQETSHIKQQGEFLDQLKKGA